MSLMLLRFFLVLLMFAVEGAYQQQLGTPVIGGICKLDTPDVHIGGKQTQFFLRCEPNTDSAQGEGVWVVKSRHAGSTSAKIPAAAVVSQQEIEQGEQNSRNIEATKQISSYVCDLVSDAVEHGYCSTSENCLQPVYTDRTAFLQCDPTTRRWTKKHCQSGFNFDFERQACIAHTAKMTHHFRQFPICPTGAPALGPCSPGYCVAPMQCAGALCCAPPTPVMAPPPPPPPIAYACPGELHALGPCIGGRCAAPAICASPSNVCCAQPSVPTAIPATVCPDGTQAAGACVNGQCGAGFTCNQGLCCTNSSQTPRCLDGSQSIGACIQGRCGTGYTCTTGNICCPSQLNLCPPGQTSVGQAVNGRCPAGYTNFNGQCCGPQSAQSQVSCSVEDSFGRCDSNQQCAEPGYACDVANNWCCPQVIGDAIGPCIQGEGGNRLCPEGYACVGEGEGQCFRLDTGTCAPEEQSGPCAPDGTCPPGYECIEGFCCQTDAGGANPAAAALRLFHQRRRRRRASASSSAFLKMINYDRGSRQPTQNRNSQK